MEGSTIVVVELAAGKLMVLKRPMEEYSLNDAGVTPKSRSTTIVVLSDAGSLTTFKEILGGTITLTETAVDVLPALSVAVKEKLSV